MPPWATLPDPRRSARAPAREAGTVRQSCRVRNAQESCPGQRPGSRTARQPAQVPSTPAAARPLGAHTSRTVEQDLVDLATVLLGNQHGVWLFFRVGTEANSIPRSAREGEGVGGEGFGLQHCRTTQCPPRAVHSHALSQAENKRGRWWGGIAHLGPTAAAAGRRWARCSSFPPWEPGGFPLKHSPRPCRCQGAGDPVTERGKCSSAP